MRSDAKYPGLVQLGNGLNRRAVIVLAPISDFNEDQLLGAFLHDEINLAEFAGIILSGEF